MPEGDSLVRLAHRLRPVMEDQVVIRTDFRTPRLATVDLAGWQVTSLTPTAKYLSIALRAPENIQLENPDLVILSHLGMDGSWQIDAHATHHTRCILHFKNHRVVGFSLPTLEVLQPDKAQRQLAFLGPDLLDPGWEQPDTARELLSKALINFRQAPDQPIGTALLDQRLISGVGNIYRCEVLLFAGISPHRSVAELTQDQLTGLIHLSRNLMLLNVPPRAPAHATRTTLDVRPDVQAPFGIRVATPREQARSQQDRRHYRGRAPAYWVYGRQRQGCLRCGNPVLVDTLGTGPGNERNVYWCPHCQLE